MKNKKFRVLIAIVCLALMVAAIPLIGACAKPAETPTAGLPTVNWKCQMCCPYMSPEFREALGSKPSLEADYIGFGTAMTYEIARIVSEKTDGKFTIKPFAANELFGVGEAYEALEEGAIEMWYGPPWAFAGRNPIGYVSASLPYSIENHDQAYDIMYNTNLQEILRGAYANSNIYYISPAMGGADSITTTFEVNSMADLKGKKIRGGGPKGEILVALGAVSVPIAPAEIYTALQQGVVEGAFMPLGVFGEWGYFEVTRYVPQPPIFSNWWVDYAANMDAWNALPEEYQNILQEACDEMWEWSCNTHLPLLESSVQEEWSQKGITYTILSDEALAEIKEAVYPLWDQWAALSPENAEVVALYREYLGIE